MSFVDAVGAFLVGIISLAAIATIVAPNSQMAQIITSFGNASSQLVRAAKGM